MPRLNPEEVGQIVAYKESGICAEVIARKLNRSSGVVRNYLRNPQNYKKAKWTAEKKR